MEYSSRHLENRPVSDQSFETLTFFDLSYCLKLMLDYSRMYFQLSLSFQMAGHPTGVTLPPMFPAVRHLLQYGYLLLKFLQDSFIPDLSLFQFLFNFFLFKSGYDHLPDQVQNLPLWRKLLQDLQEPIKGFTLDILRIPYFIQNYIST